MKIREKLKHRKTNKIEKRKIIEGINKKYLKNGSYSVAISAVFIVIVVVVNLIVNEIPSKYSEIDISNSKIYSIGEQTTDMLDELEKDVTIYQIAQSGLEDEVISNLLKKYEEGSDHIKVEVKDPIVNPQFTSEYTDQQVSSNSLIVVCGDRSKVVDYSNLYESTMDYNTYSYTTTGFDGEGQITSAIAYVTSENLPVLYTLSGHGEIELDSTIQEDIEKSNIEIKSLNLISEETVPEDADCLMINSPATDISEDEKDAIIEYLENGGKAIIFSDYTTESLDNFDKILENYGVKRVDGIVIEGDAQHYAMQMPYYLLPDVNSTEATSDFASSGYYVLAPYAQGIQKIEDVRDTVTVESILTTSDSAYSKTDLNSETLEKEEDDIDGPFDLGVSITETVDDDKTTQIIYFSTANLMDSQVNMMVSGGNEQLVMSAINSMNTSDENTAISIPSKSVEVSYLTLSAYDSSFWTICTIGLIPGIFLVFGFVIWFKRRKA